MIDIRVVSITMHELLHRVPVETRCEWVEYALIRELVAGNQPIEIVRMKSEMPSLAQIELVDDTDLPDAGINDVIAGCDFDDIGRGQILWVDNVLSLQVLVGLLDREPCHGVCELSIVHALPRGEMLYFDEVHQALVDEYHQLDSVLLRASSVELVTVDNELIGTSKPSVNSRDDQVRVPWHLPLEFFDDSLAMLQTQLVDQDEHYKGV